MCAKKKKRKSKKSGGFFEFFIILVVFPLLLVNVWVGWKVIKIAKLLEVPIFGSVNDGPIQLAGLLMANCIIIVMLSILKGK